MASAPYFMREFALASAIGYIRTNKSKSAVRRISFLAAAVLAAVSIYMVLPTRASMEASDPSPARRIVYPDQSAIGLSGMKTGRDIRIVWNSHSSSFADVKLGVLTIKDGRSYREIALTAADLESRHITYTPLTERVEASLELFSPDRKSVRESVVFVLRSRDTASRPVPERAAIAQMESREISKSEL
jgi:hypothetical protein